MGYISKQDLLDELGEDTLVQLSDNDGDGDIESEKVVNRINKAIEYAQSILDAHCRLRYSLPVPVTALVKTICLDLAVFHLYKSRATVVKDSVYEVKKIANDDAVKLLLNISQGKAALDVPATEETIENPASSDQILTNAGRSKFTDSKLSGY